MIRTGRFSFHLMATEVKREPSRLVRGRQLNLDNA